MNKTFRGFVAVKIPDEIRSSIASFQESIRLKGIKCRSVKPKNIHLTLSFLGEVKSALEPEISATLKKDLAGFGAFDIKVLGTGVFPDMARARVLWCGLKGNIESVLRLKASIDKSLNTFGLMQEGRVYKPHLTIGRFKGKVDGKDLDRILRNNTDRSFGSFRVHEITFFRSDLRPDGPHYSEIKKIGLN